MESNKNRKELLSKKYCNLYESKFYKQCNNVYRSNIDNGQANDKLNYNNFQQLTAVANVLYEQVLVDVCFMGVKVNDDKTFDMSQASIYLPKLKNQIVEAILSSQQAGAYIEFLRDLNGVENDESVDVVLRLCNHYRKELENNPKISL